MIYSLSGIIVRPIIQTIHGYTLWLKNLSALSRRWYVIISLILTSLFRQVFPAYSEPIEEQKDTTGPANLFEDEG